MLQLALVHNHFKAIHMRLAMIQRTLRAYNASSQLIISVKRMFVENPNARRVMRVGMVNSFPA